MGVKADFDTANRLVVITEAPVVPAGAVVAQQTIDVEIDLYSDAKEDWELNADGNKRKNRFPFNTAESAGSELPGGQVEPAFFRFRNDLGWRILPFDSDHELTLIGNLVPADPNLPIFAPRTGRTILIFRDGSQVAQMTNTTINEALATPIQHIEEVHGQVPRRIFIDTELVAVGNGYQQTPFNNWTDAVDEAEAIGLTSLVLTNDATIDRQIKNFTIFGNGNPTIDLNGQNVDGTTIERATLFGAFNGTLNATECALVNVSNMTGIFFIMSIAGTLTPAPGQNLIISRVAPAVAGQDWVMNMNSGQPSTVAVHNISGGVIVTNMDHPDDLLQMHFEQGVLTIDSSCTDGELLITGDVEVIDNSNGTNVQIITSSIKVKELWQSRGLQVGNPTTFTPTSIKTLNGDIDAVISGDGENTSTVTRQ